MFSWFLKLLGLSKPKAIPVTKRYFTINEIPDGIEKLPSGKFRYQGYTYKFCFGKVPNPEQYGYKGKGELRNAFIREGLE